MSTPHVCPRCNGECRIPEARFGALSNLVYRECPVCEGEGVLWEPKAISLTYRESKYDPRDYNG